MKKLALFVALVLALCALSACSSKNETTGSESAQSETTELTVFNCYD